MSPPRSRSMMTRVLMLISLAACAGCRAPPISDTDERSPYDRYDYLRNQRAEGYTEDQYGKKIPNLRERLLPHE